MLRTTGLLILTCAAASTVLSGCTRSSDPVPSSTQNSSTTRGGSAETEGEKCRKRLAAAIRRVAPETLSFQARPERAINGLNAWISSCEGDALNSLEIGQTTAQLVNDNPRTTAGRFTANDANYIRDCILLRDLSNSIWQRVDATEDGTGKDQARVIALFDRLVRNISLTAADEQRVPLGLFDVMLTGRGSVQDRAWAFVEALRQQHIHAAFVLRTAADPAADGASLDTATTLIAVMLEDGVLIFDPQIGILLTAPSEALTPLPFQQLKTHERWQQTEVLIVAQHSTFAPRMLVLQNELAAEDAAVFFEELAGGTSEITPLMDLAQQLGGEQWEGRKVRLWQYPEEQSVAAASLSEEQTTQFQQLMRPYDAPFEREIMEGESFEELTTVPEELSDQERTALMQQRLMNEFMKMVQSATSEEKYGKPSKRLLKTRIRQIRGFIDTGVIQQLQQIRIASMEDQIVVRVPLVLQQQQGLPPTYNVPLPDLILEVNRSSTGDAMYWTAMCQMDQGEVGAAILTLKNYRRQYPDGKWKFPSLMNEAICLQVQNRDEASLEVLKSADVEANPERGRVQHLLQQWQS
ncbi:MAG: hypothetical protein Fues2KO_36480 [Fuerstiella sp.]